jgi:hypothetical protein
VVDGAEPTKKMKPLSLPAIAKDTQQLGLIPILTNWKASKFCKEHLKGEPHERDDDMVELLFEQTFAPASDIMDYYPGLDKKGSDSV